MTLGSARWSRLVALDISWRASHRVSLRWGKRVQVRCRLAALLRSGWTTP